VSVRAIVVGDLLALLTFALLGLASHEHEVSAPALARTFVPFAVSWLVVGGLTGMLKPNVAGHPATGARFLVAYLVAGVVALVARSIIFDRTLFNAFFVIALVGNGILLFGWRALAGIVLSRRSIATGGREATRP